MTKDLNRLSAEADRLRKIIDTEAPFCTCALAMYTCRHCQLEERLMDIARQKALEGCPEEIQELRDWAARKMGWFLEPESPLFKIPIWRDEKFVNKIHQSDWQPDNPSTGQIWMLVEKMRELGFIFDISCWPDKDFKYEEGKGKGKKYRVFFAQTDQLIPCQAYADNPCLAILKAARATEE